MPNLLTILRSQLAIPKVRLTAVLAIVLFSFTPLAIARAQTTQSVTDGYTPVGLAPGAPAGAFALSGFDNINAFNGNLNFRLLLRGVQGRGGAAYAILLPIEQRWRIETTQIAGYPPIYSPTINWWDAFRPGYGPGLLHGRKTGTPLWCGINYNSTFTRLTFTTPDGTEFELRDQLNQGAPGYGQEACGGGPGISRGKVFVTVDGTSATFISDYDIYDAGGDDVVATNGYELISPSGYLMIADGTRYRIDTGRVSWSRDRNGNRLSFVYDVYSRVTSITDSLNRQVTIAYDVNDGAPYGLCDRITYKGGGGASRIIRVSKTSLSNALRSGQTLQTYGSLFPEVTASGSTFNPTVTGTLWLPNGRSYQFRYNSYAELARVVLPTGGAYEYDWAAGATGGATSGTLTSYAPKAIYRRVIERRVLPNGTTLEKKTTFSRPEYRVSEGVYGTVGYVTVEHFNASGTRQAASKHYFYGGSAASLIRVSPSWNTWKEGKEYQTDLLDTNGTTVLNRNVDLWQQRAWVSWAAQGDDAPPTDPRITESTTTLEPNGANLISKRTYSFEVGVPYNNRTDTFEYDFGTGTPGNLVRRTHFDYLKVNPVNGASYDTVNPNTSNPDPNVTIHIRSLPVQQQVFDAASAEKSRTTYEYDNYANDGSHAPLMPRTSISGLDGAFTSSYLTRGNATRVTNWILSSSTQLHSYSQLDVAGNVVKFIDARGYATTLDYLDCFGAPDGDARLNSGSVELGSQVSYAFPTKVTNALGHEVHTQFDYYLGKPVDGEDTNGVVSSGYHEDLLDRPTKLISAANQGGSVMAQTLFSYDDVNRIITTRTDHNSFNDSNPLKSEILHDGLGRTLEKRQYETATTFISIKTEYDGLGRAYKASNPYRSGDTVLWTTSGFDALGRVVSVTTPDSAVASTAYSGDRVLVTDQIGKQRISKTNALGQLKNVWEVTAADSATETISFPGHPEVTAGYRTTYSYDVLDDLITVSQGVQTRTFAYDSLKRLTSATNPESGTVLYQFDNNGNLLVRTDARGASAHYEYDALNRLKRNWYNGSSAVSATVHNSPALPSGVGTSQESTYFYDLQTLPAGAPSFDRGFSVGRLVATTYGTGSSEGSYSGYDAKGRILRRIQRTGTSNYEVSAIYNRAGGVTSETYPSSRTVNYGYDPAGRVNSFSGNLGDGVNRTFSTGIVYSPLGGMTQEQFGTDTAIYNKLFYNARGQLSEIRESTQPNNTNWNRGAIINHYSNNCWGMCGGQSMTDNNGNAKKQEVYIPDNEGISSYVVYTSWFSYDALNRLKYANGERWASGPNIVSDYWKQTFIYDRYGNRRIDPSPAQTYGGGINNKDFTVTTANNRLGVPGGQSGVMSFDAAGNLTNDAYSGAGNRTYDAENRITQAWGGNNQWQYYTYNGDGQRVRRKVNNKETWQVYGINGELVAEYDANAVPGSAPLKEYGYRNRQLLVTAEPVNLALGKPATQSSTHAPGTTDAGKAVDGNTNGTLWDGYASATNYNTNAWWQLDLGSVQSIGAIQVWGRSDCCPEMTTNYYVFVSDNPFTSTNLNTTLNQPGVSYYYVPGYSGTPGTVNANRTGRYIRVQLAASQYLVLGEVKVLRNTADVNWLVSDQLGTPRMVFDKTGSFASVKRHDYLPFGEEISAYGGRTPAQGYVPDGLRQQFTLKERDNETGLDYFLARYYSAAQGRFTSVDPFNIALETQQAAELNPERARALFNAYLSQPQQWNRYSYAINNPLLYVDPDGEAIQLSNDKDERERQMQALREAVGAEAGAYLYVNQGTNADGSANYYVGIREGGPGGNGPTFAQLNEVAGELGAVIRDTQVVGLEFVRPGPIGGGVTMGRASDCPGCRISPAVTGEFNGRLTIKMLDWSKHDLGYLPGKLMSNGQDNMVTPSVMLGHELGHARARMTGFKDARGNQAAIEGSLRLENKIRKLQFPSGPTRTRH